MKVKSPPKYFCCKHLRFLTNSDICLRCSEKTIPEGKNYISCSGIRLIEKPNVNETLPLGYKLQPIPIPKEPIGVVKKKFELGIAIVSLYNLELLKKCIESIKKNTKIPYQIIVWDNSHTTDNIKWLESQNIPYWWIGKNVGNAEPNNILIEYFSRFKIKYVALVSQDCLILPNALEILIEEAEKKENAGIIGFPQANYMDLPIKEDGKILALAGEIYLVRIEAWQDCKIDNNFVAWGWDPEWCFRMNYQTKWNVYCLKNPPHKGYEHIAHHSRNLKEIDLDIISRVDLERWYKMYDEKYNPKKANLPDWRNKINRVTIKDKKERRIVVLTPKYNDYEEETKKSIRKAIKSLKNIKFTFLSVREVYIHAARRKLLQYALELHKKEVFDYFLWLDSDIEFQPEDIIKLIKFIESGKGEAVTGLYFSRHEIRNPMVCYGNIINGYNWFIDYEHNKHYKIDGCGFGFFLKSKKLVEEYTDYYPPTEWFDSSKWYPEIVKPYDRIYVVGEDLDFCNKAKKIGYDIWLNTEVILSHKGIGEKDWIEAKNNKFSLTHCPVKIERF